jgi:FkbM family methyltransferase
VATGKRFVSYSANFEDVMLRRVFQAQDRGFFVDIGAAHPVFENDMKALYDRGWRGINVEPVVVFFRELVAQRPEDRNLNVAVSDSAGEILVHEVVGTGLSTCNAEAVEHARQQGYEVIPRTVSTLPLRSILTDAAAPKDIDVLKVDVEGLELSVLQSNDWSRFRPKLILVEATFPETPVRRPDHVRPFLEAQGYQHVYFDGLNDFFSERNFVSPEGAFAVPPNVFDGFKLFTQKMVEDQRDALAAEASDLVRVRRQAEASAADVAAARVELAAMHERMRAMASDLERADEVNGQLRDQLQVTEDTNSQLRDQLQATEEINGQLRDQLQAREEINRQLRDQLQAMYGSTSWKVTRPLRAISRPRRAIRLLSARLAR